MKIIFRQKLFVTQLGNSWDKLLANNEYVCREFIKSIIMYESNYNDIPHWIEELSASISNNVESCNRYDILLGYVFFAALENNDKTKFIKSSKHQIRLSETLSKFPTPEVLFKKSIQFIKKGQYSKVLVQNEIDKVGMKDYSDFFLYIALCLSVPGLFKSRLTIQEILRQFRSGKIKSSNFENINLHNNRNNEVLKYILGTCLARFMEEYFGMEINPKLQHDILDKENTNSDIRKL